jgi:serine/threonine protein kinase
VSPEVAMKRKYNGSVDLWGVGILAFELITGHVPFKDPNKDKHLSNIINCDQYNILYPKWMETEARDFIGKLLKKDPLLRITVRQALQHPFIKKYQATEVIPSDIGDLIYLK